MAWLDKRGTTFRLVFQLQGQTYKRSLKTGDRREAHGIAAAVQRKINLIERGDLSLPDGIDVPTFLITNGRVERPLDVAQAVDTSLASVVEAYLASITEGSLEENTIATLTTHLNHLCRVLGDRFDLPALGFSDLQRYIGQRAKARGHHGKTIRPYTIRKELTSFGQLWSWARRVKLVEHDYPNDGLRYPKATEKPKFQTFDEIERQIAKSKLTDAEQTELWDCLYLTPADLDEVLDFVRNQTSRPFMYPMILLAAHTGARRSEILRSQVSDFDFRANILLLREKKRVKGKTTTRSVPMSPRLRRVMESWLGEVSSTHAFQLDGTPMSVDQASTQFNATFAGSKWEKLKGWHVFRHSFISNCASKGIDQRMIDAWSGHQTDEMRKRYTHLIPTAQQSALQTVFGA